MRYLKTTFIMDTTAFFILCFWACFVGLYVRWSRRRLAQSTGPLKFLQNLFEWIYDMEHPMERDATGRPKMKHGTPVDGDRSLYKYSLISTGLMLWEAWTFAAFYGSIPVFFLNRVGAPLGLSWGFAFLIATVNIKE